MKRLDINSLEGWKEMIRQDNIKALIKRGIVPTDEAIEKYEVERLKSYEGMAMEHIEVPIFYYVDDIRFNTEKDAIEYKDILETLQGNSDLLDLFNIIGNDKELLEVAANNLK